MTALDELDTREWLVPLGNGGYASSTVCGVRTRSYHGLLVGAYPAPRGRLMLVTHVDEIAHTGGVAYELATHHFEPDVIHPGGARWLAGFTSWPMPRWVYAIGATRLARTLRTPGAGNTVLLDYSLLEGPDVTLELRPFLTCRTFHGGRGPVGGTAHARSGGATWAPEGGGPLVHVDGPVEVAEDEVTWHRFRYEQEARRGCAHTEDVTSPFRLRLALSAAAPSATLRLSDRPATGEEAGAGTTAAPGKPSVDARLRRAALACVTADPADGRPGVVAGYHWFNEWGRDTMIAVPGVAAARGGWDEAIAIMEGWVSRLDAGLLPNRLAETETADLDNSADASLWLARALDLAAADVPSARLRASFYEPLTEIVACYSRGTRHGIGVSERDGLLRAGAEGLALTWMDAKIGDEVVTPRRGRCVELNALFFGALVLLAAWQREEGHDADAGATDARSRRLRASFADAFWDQPRGCLRDVADDDDGGVRPNQLFALAGRESLVAPGRARAALATVERELLTPFGLRTLSPNDPRYRGTYAGDQPARDCAYHQGTVWPWLLGVWTDAALVVRGDTAAVRAACRRRLLPVLADLDAGGLDHLSEVFDGDPPHRAGGAIAQAWSAAEVLRACRRVGLK